MPLIEATGETCGAKAGVLGMLLRAVLPVPDGFVVPFAVHRAAVGDLARVTGPERDGRDAARDAIEGQQLPPTVMEALRSGLEQLGDPPVAVRSSAADEDTDTWSAAGQYASVLGVRDVADVADAVRVCWASLHSSHATAYRTFTDDDRPAANDLAMAVLVQRHIDAEVSGVLFTHATQDEPTVIEASWGLGPSVVAGTVTPDAYRVESDGTVVGAVADKPTRIDRYGARLLTADVPAELRQRATLDDVTAAGLARLGSAVAAILDGPQDIEWAITKGRVWLLQARPITATPPAPPALDDAQPDARTLSGIPGSRGRATGIARRVRGPQDFSRVRPGDILVCPFTDPAWTPLLRIAAGVVTEAGGALSHAAIVAREHHIPAVLGVPDATKAIIDGAVVTIDGSAGTVITATTDPRPPAR